MNLFGDNWQLKWICICEGFEETLGDLCADLMPMAIFLGCFSLELEHSTTLRFLLSTLRWEMTEATALQVITWFQVAFKDPNWLSIDSCLLGWEVFQQYYEFSCPVGNVYIYQHGHVTPLDRNSWGGCRWNYHGRTCFILLLHSFWVFIFLAERHAPKELGWVRVPMTLFLAPCIASFHKYGDLASSNHDSSNGYRKGLWRQNLAYEINTSMKMHQELGEDKTRCSSRTNPWRVSIDHSS